MRAPIRCARSCHSNQSVCYAHLLLGAAVQFEQINSHPVSLPFSEMDVYMPG